jgi:hypothetical protein
LALTRRRTGIVGKVGHGINEVGGTGHSIPSAQVELHQTAPGRVSAIDELNRAVTGSPIPTGHVPLSDLAMQSVVAHRMWADALQRKERFLAIERLALLHDESARTIWATVSVRSDRLRRYDWGVGNTLAMSGLGTDFRTVDTSGGCRTFEQITPVHYTGRAADKVMDVVALLRPHVWQTVTAAAPFRRYYLFLSSGAEKRLHQITSVYALLFWLGSLTRYQPAELLDLLNGTYGGFLREFLATQPAQLLYLVASEFRKQDVARAAIV